MVEGIPEDSIAIDIDEESVDQNSTVSDWGASIEKRCLERKFKTASIADGCSISRVSAAFKKSDGLGKVSAAFKESDGLSFKPQTISIGPMQLEPVGDEDHKWRYLQDILNRRRPGCLTEYLRALGRIERQTRECYKSDTVDDRLDSKSFLEKMLVDGCFIIELFSKAAMDDQRKNDPLLKSDWTMKNVARDLILLENQIPFLVLQCLFHKMNTGNGGTSLAKMALDFFNKFLNIRYSDDPNVCSYSDDPNVCSEFCYSHDPKVCPKFHPQHLLHLLHHCCFPLSAEAGKTNSAETGKTKNFGGTIPSASELKRAGIKFNKRNDTSLFDIKFQNGEICISPFVLDDHACSLFCNFLAFEQCYHACNKNIMIYIHFMECLIDSPGDFEILTRREIICNNLGTNEVVTGFFKRLVNQVALCGEHDYLGDVRCDIIRYYYTIYRRWRASLVRIFEKNPWTVVSVAVAITLQLLTLLQRIYMPK